MLVVKYAPMQDDALGDAASEAVSPGPGLMALNKSDMHAFIALSGFFAELLPQLDPLPFVRSARCMSV